MINKREYISSKINWLAPTFPGDNSNNERVLVDTKGSGPTVHMCKLIWAETYITITSNIGLWFKSFSGCIYSKPAWKFQQIVFIRIIIFYQLLSV